MRAALAVLIALLAGLILLAYENDNFLFVEQHETTTGNDNGLIIGMDRNQVLAVVKALGAQVISATPCPKFRVSEANIVDLPVFEGLEGIRVTSPSAFVDIYFADKQVSRIAHGPRIDLMPITNIGDDMNLVRIELLHAIEKNDGLSVAPIVNFDDNGVLALNTASANQLRSHRCWRFEINSIRPAGAVYEIEFQDDRLKRILYRRARIRSE